MCNFKIIVYIQFLYLVSIGAQDCVPRDYGQGSIVCVCNATYCDYVEPTTAEQFTGNVVRHYVSAKDGRRLEPMTMEFEDGAVEEDTITFSVNRDSTYQDVNGFGGAATDATGVNKRALSEDAGDKLIRAYFSPEGIGYTIIRVPVGGSDFSTHFYTYDDGHKDDMNLKFFNLTEEDYTLKIPLIKRAQELSPIPIRLFSSPWSAPDWMKDINDTTKASRLDERFYEVYANYYVSFLDAYAEQNVEFWGLTPQNEPDHGLEYGLFNSMGWYPSEMLEWIVGYLGPALDDAGYADLKIMINDHQRTMISKWAELYKNESLSKFVSGMAVHWYTDQDSDPKILTQFHNEYPEKFLLYTEACVMPAAEETSVILGSWERGERYMTDILEVMNNWVTGWTDWNMALDLEGGPNWVSNFVDAPIIVNATADEFYKQPMFYALAHFSKFVPPGSVHIGLDSDDDTGIENIAFLTPDNVTVVILQNRNSTEEMVSIVDKDRGHVVINVPARSDGEVDVPAGVRDIS